MTNLSELQKDLDWATRRWGELDSRTVALQKVFSDEARAAALEARRAKSSGGKEQPNTEATKLQREKIDAAPVSEPGKFVPKEMEGRYKNPPQPTHQAGERPIDYGHVGELLREKYGEKRGQSSYDAMVDNPKSDRGLYFVVGQRIMDEKRTMMNDLGLKGDSESHPYQKLHQQWTAKKASPAPPSSKD